MTTVTLQRRYQLLHPLGQGGNGRRASGARPHVSAAGGLSRCFGDVGRKTFKSYPVSLVDGGSSLELTCFYGTPPQMKITWARGHGFYFPRRGVVCSKQ